jgi:hypothetical protein
MANTYVAGEATNRKWQDIIAYYSQRGSATIYVTKAAINNHQPRDPVTHRDPVGYDVNKWVNSLAARYVQGTFGFDACNSPSPSIPTAGRRTGA